jgi:hypothetical protein
MSSTARCVPEKPRELRRRVKIQARVRATGGWADACILNLSSRGMMINAARPSTIQGNTIELWHGERLVVATVVWRKGTRAGLRSEQRVPVEEILAESSEPSLQLTAALQPAGYAPAKADSHDASRFHGRAIEFAGILIVGATLAASAFEMIQRAFALPLFAVRAALQG